jgi:sugar phosphate isomerase/epimerase
VRFLGHLTLGIIEQFGFCWQTETLSADRDPSEAGCRSRICEIHLKDNPHYLWKGKIDFKAVIDALADVGFAGWARLETDSPGSVEAAMLRNLKFIRGLITAHDAA